MSKQDKIIHPHKLILILCAILLFLKGAACKNSTHNNLPEKNKIKTLLLQGRKAHFEKKQHCLFRDLLTAFYL